MRHLNIKPHHFVDIVTSIGGGTRDFLPHHFGHALHLVARQVLEDPHTLLELELGPDDICRPCIHNVEGICDDVIDVSFRPDAPFLKREWNLLLDRRWCECLGLEAGGSLTAREFCELLRTVGSETLQGIYREIPAALTAERGRKLKAGIELMLASG